jgi:ATP-dependent Clp protease adapter protein ClpS
MAKMNSKHRQTKQSKFSFQKKQLFKVTLIDNAAYVPMKIIDRVLRKVLGEDYQQAQFSTLALTQYGYAVCGVYPKATAKEKVNKFKSLIKEHRLTLKCDMKRI